MMQDGNGDVFTLGTTVPASSVMDLASSREVKLIGIDDTGLAAMKKINPGYTRVTVKAGTYPKQASDVPVIGYATHLIASCSLPENTVYQMVKAIAANTADLTAITNAISGLTPKVMGEDIGVPMHPGAAKFYKEQGL
jgi:TRAP transporter TAXI family solute receptor